jgi:hypothetical protein
LGAQLTFRRVDLFQWIDASSRRHLPLVFLVPDPPQLLISILGSLLYCWGLILPAFRKERARVGGSGIAGGEQQIPRSLALTKPFRVYGTHFHYRD